MQEKSKVTYSFGKLTMVKSDKTPIEFMKKKKDALLKNRQYFQILYLLLFLLSLPFTSFEVSGTELPKITVNIVENSKIL